MVLELSERQTAKDSSVWARSAWSSIMRGDPQGPLFCLLNDLPHVIKFCSVNLYAGDIAIYFASKISQGGF